MISLAFLAGVLAAFNPCGFALLPAYLGSIILTEDGSPKRWSQNGRAMKFSLGMTIGFIGVFGSFALVLTSFAGSVAKFLPLATVLIGIFLIVISSTLILKKSLILKKIFNPNMAPTQRWVSQVGYGVSFALASLSCTIGPFLAITAAAIQGRNFFGILTLFISYSFGMGSVVLMLALLVAAARTGFIHKLRGSQGGISVVSGYLLFLVGIYEVWYGWFEIRVFRGMSTSDPIISFASRIESKVIQWISHLGTGSLLAAIVLILTALLLLGARKRKIIRSKS